MSIMIWYVAAPFRHSVTWSQVPTNVIPGQVAQDRDLAHP